MSNDIIARAFRRVGVPFILEPPGLIRGDGKRPDGATQISWRSGHPLLWDFTCPDTLAPLHIRKSSFLVGAVAEGAEARKIIKYSGLLHTHSFAPVAIETLRVWGAGAEKLLEELGWRMAEVTKKARSKSFLRHLDPGSWYLDPGLKSRSAEAETRLA